MKELRNILRGSNLCVLSTTSNNLQPNSSLMQYSFDETLNELHMMTSQESSKSKNIEENSRVSLLIDTREDSIFDVSKIMALTIYGRAVIAKNAKEKEKYINELVSLFPSLDKFAQSSNCEIIIVKPEKFLLLNGVTDSKTFTLEEFQNQ